MRIRFIVMPLFAAFCFLSGSLKAEDFARPFPVPISVNSPINASSMAHLLEVPAGKHGFIRAENARFGVAVALGTALLSGRAGLVQEHNPEIAKLAGEVAKKGWIVFSAKTDQLDFDLFVCRPDGSERRNLTNTPGFLEFGARLSPDGKKMLYRRLTKTNQNVTPNHDRWGQTGALVIANADGSHPLALGQEGDLLKGIEADFAWASWSPDGKKLACLHRDNGPNASRKGEGVVRIVDVETKAVLQEMSAHGIYQQLFWSPDGKRVCGTANVQGAMWNIIGIELESGKATRLTRDLNCTPDWFHEDVDRVIYSSRKPGLGSPSGFTLLMQAKDDGTTRSLIYGEYARHVYFGCTSPDDRYVVFSTFENDGGLDGPMGIIRMADTPIIVGDGYTGLRRLYPKAKTGPVLRLPHAGFEPLWTNVDFGAK